MSRPAVFFDRDNTLIANSDYLGDPEGVVLIAGAADAVARVRRLGFVTVVVSNQSGVGRGMFTEDDVHAVNDRMNAALLELDADAIIDHHEFCAHHPKATIEQYKGDHRRRKPQPGMLLDAAESLDLDLGQSWLIGDAPRDVEAGHRAGCRTILVRERLDSVSPAAAEHLKVEPDYIASSLQDAVDFIEMQLEQAAPVETVVGTIEDETDDAPRQPLVARDDLRDAFAPSTELIAADEVRAIDETSIGQSPLEQASIEDPLREPLQEPFRESTFSNAGSVAGRDTGRDSARDEIIVEPHVAHVASSIAVMNDAITSTAPPADAEKHQTMLLERILEELRRTNDPPQDFSIARMLGGIVQGFAIALMFGALLYRDNPPVFTTMILIAIFLQLMVSSLILMGR
jgi:D-glycero-D-manno-heptose 1,7-bisphosphate phosphatase